MLEEPTVTMSATDFKARCLDIIDQVHDGAIRRLIITKRGQPMAEMTASHKPETPLIGFMRGSFIITPGVDLTAPVLDEPLFAADGRLHE